MNIIPTIAAVEVAEVELAVRPELVVRSSRGLHAVSPFAIVRVHASDGTIGHGEISATRFWSGEDSTSAAHFLRTALRSTLVGQPLAPVAALATRMDVALGGNPFTKAGVSAALWDALGRSVGLPVVTLLGGAFRREVPAKAPLSGDRDELESGYAAARALGFEAFKVKVGFDPHDDAARFAHARRLVGDDAFLGLDANGGWSRVSAMKAIELTRAANPAFIEQPVDAADLVGMRQMRGRGAPVLADEAVYSIGDLVRLVQADAADAVSVYVGKSAGLERAVEQGRLAEAFGLQVVLGSNLESDLGTAAILHVACAIEGLSTWIPSGVGGPLHYVESLVKTPLDIDGRRAVLPQGPGLGVEPLAELDRRFR